MYHTDKINQAPQIKKSLLSSFSPKHSQLDHYTSTDQKLFKILLRFKNAPFKTPSNAYLADQAGCSISTVIRATNKFHRDGSITKSQKNRYSFNDYSFRMQIDHENKRIFQSEYDTLNLSSSLIIDLFINLSPTAYAGGRKEGVFKKTYQKERWKDPKKGETMHFSQKPPSVIAKLKQKKRNDGGHSPAVLKPVLPLADQIHSKKVDVAFFEKQLENPEAFWDPRGILFSVNIAMVKSLLATARFELNELEVKSRNSNEKQSVLREYNSDTMETCSA